MSKKNAEFSVGYIQRIVATALGIEQKIRVLEGKLDSYADSIVRTTAKELASSHAVTEEALIGLLKN